MQLLTVGRSLKPFKDKPSPFTMKQPILLPKFGPKAEQDATARDDDRRVLESDLLEEPATKPLTQASVQAESLRSRLLRIRAAKPALIQTELSLEEVRVIRNDLQESGAAQRSGASPFRSGKPRQTVTVAGDWWTRLQRRLFARARKQD